MYFFFLASYSYTNDRNFYLETLDYANGDSVQYEYDQQGRVTKQTYEDASYVTYDYDNSGALATVYDSETGISTTYYYDLIDRMMKYVESGSGYSHSVGYEYDTINNLTQMVETINGVKHTTSYGYDDDNRVISITNDLTPDVADDGITESYTYDTHGRVATKVTKNGDATVLTESYEYVGDGTASLSGLVRKLTISSDSYSIVYEYTYDDNGNIASIGDGTAANTITYEYDAANQLVRENNPRTNKTYTWEYDNAGNILHENTYAYTTGTPGNATYTENYDYDDSQWGDLLTEWRNQDLSYDGIGNLTRDNQDNVYTWKNGRQLASYKQDGNEREEIYYFEYNADGLRTKAYNAYTTYNYIYNGSSLVQMTVDGSTLNFTYDMSGVPQTVTYNGTTYFYATNLQGDVTDILDSEGTVVVSYTYDAWGNHTSGNNGTGSLASTLGRHNPLRYRGYVYDVESELYYLQSRYYSPALGRFITSDIATSTGQGLLGNNTFAYCGNNPVSRADSGGYFWDTIFDVVSLVTSVVDVVNNPDDVCAWIGLALDVVDVVVPCVGGLGEAADAINTARKVADKADDLRDAAKVIDNSAEAVETTTKSARSSAVRKAWKNEVEQVRLTGKGSRDWTTSQIDELLSTGKVKGYVGHHMKSVKGYPELAGDPTNIQFLTRAEHLLAHGGNWRNITHGRYVP